MRAGWIAFAMWLIAGCIAVSPATSAEPVWADILSRCTGACGEALAALAPADQRLLEALPQRVQRTADQINRDPGLAWNEAARPILPRALTIAPGGDFSRVRTGERPCTVFWFGFLDNAGERVGRHRCRVTRERGTLTVEKITGDRLAAWVVPIDAGAGLFVGRTYLPGQPERRYDPDRPANASNSNFGNKSGLVFADGRSLFVIDGDMRGFTDPDDTFFEVLLIE